MFKSSKEHLLGYISHNQLKKENGAIFFDAEVIFHGSKPAEKICELHIITLPEELALYIISPTEGLPANRDMYTTAKFTFFHSENNQLDISTADEGKIVTISLLPK
jgi:hypothetical protein